MLQIAQKHFAAPARTASRLRSTENRECRRSARRVVRSPRFLRGRCTFPPRGSRDYGIIVSKHVHMLELTEIEVRLTALEKGLKP